MGTKATGNEDSCSSKNVLTEIPGRASGEETAGLWTKSGIVFQQTSLHKHKTSEKDKTKPNKVFPGMCVVVERGNWQLCIGTPGSGLNYEAVKITLLSKLNILMYVYFFRGLWSRRNQVGPQNPGYTWETFAMPCHNAINLTWRVVWVWSLLCCWYWVKHMNNFSLCKYSLKNLPVDLMMLAEEFAILYWYLHHPMVPPGTFGFKWWQLFIFHYSRTNTRNLPWLPGQYKNF